MHMSRLYCFIVALTLLGAGPAAGAIQVESVAVPMDLAIALLGG